MLTIALTAAITAIVLLLGAKGVPLTAAWFKSWTAKRAITNAKALIAKAEADAKALENARKVVAATPAAATGPVGATGA